MRTIKKEMKKIVREIEHNISVFLVANHDDSKDLREAAELLIRVKALTEVK